MKPDDFQPIQKNMTTSAFQALTQLFSNSKLIVQEIIDLNETEIKDYPLTDLAPEELKEVLNMLDSGNLSKVLLNIPIEEIKEIQKQLSSNEFNKILNRLPNDTSIAIKKNINYIANR